MKIGELARVAGVTVRTLHHYDELGLLVPSERTQAGHRMYSAAECAATGPIATPAAALTTTVVVPSVSGSDSTSMIRPTVASTSRPSMILWTRSTGNTPLFRAAICVRFAGRTFRNCATVPSPRASAPWQLAQ